VYNRYIMVVSFDSLMVFTKSGNYLECRIYLVLEASKGVFVFILFSALYCVYVVCVCVYVCVKISSYCLLVVSCGT